MLDQVPLPPKMRTRLAEIVMADSTAPPGLYAAALKNLAVAEGALCAEVLRRLRADELDERSVGLLFAGSEGLEIVTRAVANEALGLAQWE